MIKNSTVDILKRSISETKRRILTPVDKVINSGRIFLKPPPSDDPRYLQGVKKTSEAKNGAKDE